MRRDIPHTVALLSVLLLAAVLRADVHLAPIYGENCIVQQGRKLTISGTADAGEKVTVMCGTNYGVSVADAEGQWQVQIGPLTGSAEPQTLVVSGKNKIERAILVGEVWLFAGGRNMEVRLEHSTGAKETLEGAPKHPLLRVFRPQHRQAWSEPRRSLAGEWLLGEERQLRYVSAIAYHAGLDLRKTTDVPVGIVDLSWGHSTMTAWIPRDALEPLGWYDKWLAKTDKEVQKYVESDRYRKDQAKIAEWREAVAAAQAENKGRPRYPRIRDPRNDSWRPARIYNGMVAPLTGFPVAGVVWYHGQADTRHGWRYRWLLRTMIDQWRKAWGRADLPFVIVQLANYGDLQQEPVETRPDWPYLRESQLAVATSMENVALVCTTDLGEAASDRPRDKRPVAARIADAARALAYDADYPANGPYIAEATFDGAKAVLRVANVREGLEATGTGMLKGFALAGEDKQWHEAAAKIDAVRVDGKPVWQVIVTSDAVAEPHAVRYNWAMNPVGNLYDACGLPVPPFRSDTWPGNQGSTEPPANAKPKTSDDQADAS